MAVCGVCLSCAWLKTQRSRHAVVGKTLPNALFATPFLHRQSRGFVLILLLVKQAQCCSWRGGAGGPCEHQAPQEQTLLEITTFPAAPEPEAPAALRIRGRCG